MSKNNSDWEQSLQDLRRKRHHHEEGGAGESSPFAGEGAPQAALKPVSQPKPFAAKGNQAFFDARKHVLKSYLASYQREHNMALSPEQFSQEGFVVLEDGWLNMQNSLQGDVRPEAIDESTRVWLNPKCLQEGEISAGHRENGGGRRPDVPLQALDHDLIPTTVNVLKPEGVEKTRPVICLSEQVFIEKLGQKLMPHLVDAVAGMVRHTILKQAHYVSSQVQNSIEEQTPDLVRDVLDHNLKSVLSELKYDSALKRK